MIEILSSGKRLCKWHGFRIPLSRGKRYTGCWMCTEINKKSDKSKKKRKEKWETSFIPCTKHSDRRCNKSFYVGGGARRCGSCTNKYPDGSVCSYMVRHLNKQNYIRSLNRRDNFLGTMRGLKLFERSTGMDLTQFGLGR